MPAYIGAGQDCKIYPEDSWLAKGCWAGAVAMTGSGFSCGCSRVAVAGFVLSPAVADSVLVV